MAALHLILCLSCVWLQYSPLSRSCHTIRRGDPNGMKNLTKSPRPWRNSKLSARRRKTKQVGAILLLLRCDSCGISVSSKSWHFISLASSRTSGQTPAPEDEWGLLRRWGGRGGRRWQVISQKRSKFTFILLWRWRVSFILLLEFGATHSSQDHTSLLISSNVLTVFF